MTFPSPAVVVIVSQSQVVRTPWPTSLQPSCARLPRVRPRSTNLQIFTVQGALEAYYRLQRLLSEIGGMAEFTLNPYAGAHGELTGLMVIRAYHDSRGDKARTKVIVPDSAHGTNPASAAVAGLQVTAQWMSTPCVRSLTRRWLR